MMATSPSTQNRFRVLGLGLGFGVEGLGASRKMLFPYILQPASLTTLPGPKADPILEQNKDHYHCTTAVITTGSLLSLCSQVTP